MLRWISTIKLATQSVFKMVISMGNRFGRWSITHFGVEASNRLWNVCNKLGKYTYSATLFTIPNFILDFFSCAFQNSVGHDDLIQVLEEKSRKPNQRISAKLEAQIKMQYKRKIQNETDIYKCAVYGIIGCCDVPAHAKVAKTTDDFLWIQLSMIQPDDNGNMSINDDNIGSDSPTYSGLQSMILEKYGEKYFNANEQPHLYFQVSNNSHYSSHCLLKIYAFHSRCWLWLDNLNQRLNFYPVSIDTVPMPFISLWLSTKCSCWVCHEVYNSHYVSIWAFISWKSSEWTDSLNEQMLFFRFSVSIDIEDPIPLRRLNIARLIMLYVRNFEITDPAEALQYFYFLR